MPGIKAGNPTSDQSDKAQNADDEVFESNTQTVDPRPLAGVIAFVDVRSGKNGCENRGEAVSHELDALGATVSQRFNKDVTHVVFKDGKATVVEKAQKLGVFVVSVLWVDACKRANDRVSEAKYPAILNDLTGSPVVLGKLKRIKSMQPKPLEEEVAKSLERSRKRKKREEPLVNTKKAECVPKLSLGSPDSRDEEEHKANESDDSFDLPAVVFPTPSNANSDKPPEHPQTTPVSVQSTLSSRTTPDLTTALEQDKNNDVQKPAKNKKAIPNVPMKVATAESEQSKPVPNIEKKVCSAQGPNQNEQMTSKQAQKASCSDQKPSGSGFIKKRSLQRQSCAAKADSIDEEEMVVPAAQSAVEKMPATYSLTNNTKALHKAKSVAKPQSTPPKGACTPVEGSSKAVEREPKRKSTEEGTSEAKKKRRSRDKGLEVKEKPTLVMTSVAVQDQETVYAIVEKLENFEIAKTVCESTTHVICGSARRTVNVLAGTAKGCWLLSLEWVWKSLESGHWLEEEPYEMADEFPAARLFRLERQQAGPLYRPTFFSSVGSIFISSSASVSAQQLELLVSLGGGKISASQRKADVCIGCKAWSDDVKSVSVQWILDSISEHHLLRMEDYSLDNSNSRAASPEL